MFQLHTLPLRHKQHKTIAMKYSYVFILLQLLFLIPAIQNTMAQNRSDISSELISHQSTNTDYIFELPFTEDWEYNSFTHNLWTISDDSWIVDVYTGNDGASAKFKGSSMQTNYSSILTSNWLAGANMFVGTVTLKFDLKLTDIAQNGIEYLYIKLFNGTDYFTIDSINNNGSFDWGSYEYDISELTFGNDFKIVFDARGTSSTNISGWFIDNIEVYRTCESPQNLEGIAAWDYDLIKWQAPKMLIPPTPWKHWDSGENFTATGAISPDVRVAIRWDANTLNDIDGDTIKKIRYFLTDTTFNFLIIRIWTGANAVDTIYTDTVSNPMAGVWNEHILTDTLILDASLEYWVGYELKSTISGTFPFGVDAGPAVAGFGDKISGDTGTWDNLSDLGLNYNWNIEMYVAVPPDTNNHGLSHFVVYKSIEGNTNFYPMDSIDFIPGQMNYEAVDSCSIGEVACFKVNAIWGEDGDTCISEYAKNKLMPILDHICLIYEPDNIDESNSGFTFYPNPASGTLSINSESNLLNLTIYDLTGRIVYFEEVLNQNKLTVDISGLTDGMYLLKAETEQGIFSRKMIKKGN